MRPIVFLPTYNERENVRTIIPEILEAVPESSILVIDDNSPDGTAEVVKQMMAQESRIKLLERSQKQGLGEAYKYAYQEALKENGWDVVITMDADGSHDPTYLPAMLDALRSADIVIGSRYVDCGGIEDWETWRYVLSKYGNLYSRILTGTGIYDLTAGFITVRRSLIERMDFRDLGASGYAYQIEFKVHALKELGAVAREIPIHFRSRREGESKISRHVISEGLKTPLKLFIRRFNRKT